MHILVKCQVIDKFWQELKKGIESEEMKECRWSNKNIVFNSVHPKLHWYINMLVAVAKQHVYAKRCLNQKPNSEIVWKEIEFIHNLEYKNAIASGKTKRFNSRWPDKITESNVTTEEEFVNEYIMSM